MRARAIRRLCMVKPTMPSTSSSGAVYTTTSSSRRVENLVGEQFVPARRHEHGHDGILRCQQGAYDFVSLRHKHTVAQQPFGIA